MGAKIANATFSTISVQLQPTFINMLVVGEYRLLLYLAISPKLKILWH